MATWNPGIPAIGNQLSEDIPDIKENLEHLAFWAMKRSKFTYNGGATAYTVKVSAGMYNVKDKVAKWVAELTTGAIGTPAASTRYYLYLDYSAITSGTAITATELIWSSTAPTYSHTLGGWYNGDDLCIFGVISNAGPTNINVFYHDGGDYVEWDIPTLEANGVTPSTDWTDVDCATSLPAFCTKSLIHVKGVYSNANGDIQARVNSGTGPKTVGSIHSASTQSGCSVIQYTDASQVFEIRWNVVTAANSIYIWVNGWYFPVGM